MDGLLVRVQTHVPDEALQDPQGLHGDAGSRSGLLGRHTAAAAAPEAGAQPGAQPTTLGWLVRAVQRQGREGQRRRRFVVDGRRGDQGWKGLPVERDLSRAGEERGGALVRLFRAQDKLLID